MPEDKGTVLYVGGFELPDRNPAAHRVINNSKILRELGYKVVFCGVDKEIKAIPTEPDIVSGFDSFPVPYPSTTKKWVKQIFDISPYTNLISRYSDIKFIFCYNLHAVPLAKLIKVAKKKKISLVADCTEWYENKISLNPVKLIKCVDTFLCMRCFQKKCDGMIAISSYLENYYKKHIRNIIVLPPLVDLSDEKYVFHHPKEKNDVSTFIYSGSPSAAKESLGEVVECFDNITDIDYKLIIVGVTIEQFASIYGSTPKNNKIEFCGRISHREAVNAVRQSDYAIVIRPRTRVTMAGFPTKFAEAVSVGTAVIANDISDLKLYLKDGKNGYLISSEKIAEEFKRILLSDKNVVIESDTFDYKKYTEQFEIFLDTVI